MRFLSRIYLVMQLTFAPCRRLRRRLEFRLSRMLRKVPAQRSVARVSSLGRVGWSLIVTSRSALGVGARTGSPYPSAAAINRRGVGCDDGGRAHGEAAFRGA